MREQAWTRRIIVRGAVAVALAMTTLVTVPAAAQPGDRGPTGPADRVATFRVPDEGWMTNESDPTDDGSIIIECMLFDGRPLATPDLRTGGLLRSVTVPQYPLGPTKCWPREYKRT
jgi:hypothetical protein